MQPRKTRPVPEIVERFKRKLESLPGGDPRWEAISNELFQICSTELETDVDSVGASKTPAESNPHTKSEAGKDNKNSSEKSGSADSGSREMGKNVETAKAHTACKKLLQYGLLEVLVKCLPGVISGVKANLNGAVTPESIGDRNYLSQSHPRDLLAFIDFLTHVYLEDFETANVLANRFCSKNALLKRHKLWKERTKKSKARVGSGDSLSSHGESESRSSRMVSIDTPVLADIITGSEDDDEDLDDDSDDMDEEDGLSFRARRMAEVYADEGIDVNAILNSAEASSLISAGVLDSAGSGLNRSSGRGPSTLLSELISSSGISIAGHTGRAVSELFLNENLGSDEISSLSRQNIVQLIGGTSRYQSRSRTASGSSSTSASSSKAQKSSTVSDSSIFPNDMHTLCQNKRWPTVGDNVYALYSGAYERCNGRYCEAHVISNNGDGTFLLEWRDGDESGRVVSGFPSLTKIKIKRSMNSVFRVKPGSMRRSSSDAHGAMGSDLDATQRSELHSVMMKRAIPENSLSMITLLVGDGVDVNYVDPTGHTPLTMAIACACSFEFFKYLLNVGASLSVPGPFGTPLQMLCRCCAHSGDSQISDSVVDILHLFLGCGGSGLLDQVDNEFMDNIQAHGVLAKIINSYKALKLSELKQELLGIEKAEASAEDSSGSDSILEEIHNNVDDIKSRYANTVFVSLAKHLPNLMNIEVIAQEDENSHYDELLSLASSNRNTRHIDGKDMYGSANHIYVRNRYLQLLRFVIQQFPTSPDLTPPEETASGDRRKVPMEKGEKDRGSAKITMKRPSGDAIVPLFELLEHCKEGVDIEILIHLLSAICELIVKFNEFYFYGNWYGIRELASLLSKEENISSAHWIVKNSPALPINHLGRKKCASIAGKLVQIIDSVRSKVERLLTRKRSSRLSKRKRTDYESKKTGALTVFHDDHPYNILLKTEKNRDVNRNVALERALDSLKETKSWDPIVAFLKNDFQASFPEAGQRKRKKGGVSYDTDSCNFMLPLSGHKFNENDISAVFMGLWAAERQKCFEMLNSISKCGKFAMKRLLRLVRNRLIGPVPIHLHTVQFRRLNGKNVTLRSLTMPIELLVKKSPKCPNASVSDIGSFSSKDSSHSNTVMGSMVVQPMLNFSTFEKRILSLVHITDPRYSKFCQELCGKFVSINKAELSTGAFPGKAKPKDNKIAEPETFVFFVRSYRKDDSTHLLTLVEAFAKEGSNNLLRDTSKKVVVRMKLFMIQYNILDRVSSEDDTNEKDKPESAHDPNQLIFGDEKPVASYDVPISLGDKVLALGNRADGYDEGVVVNLHNDPCGAKGKADIEFAGGVERRNVLFEYIKRVGDKTKLQINMHVEVWSTFKSPYGPGKDRHSSQWLSARIMSMVPSRKAGGTTVRVRLLVGPSDSDSIFADFPLNYVRKSLNGGSGRILPTGTRVLTRKMDMLPEDTAAKSHQMVSSRSYSHRRKTDSTEWVLSTVAHYKRQHGVILYNIVQDTGIALCNMRPNDFKPSMNRAYYRQPLPLKYTGTQSKPHTWKEDIPSAIGYSISSGTVSTYSTKDDVTVAEANDAFHGLDMGKTGKPGRIVPEDDFLKHGLIEEESAKKNKVDSRSKYVKSSLKRPCIDVTWHLDVQNPAFESRSSARSYFQDSPPRSDRHVPRNRPKNKSKRKPNRETIADISFTNNEGGGHGRPETTVFGALVRLSKLNKAKETPIFRRESQSNYSSRPFESSRSRGKGSATCIAPWGITHQLCYNVSVDMQDGRGFAGASKEKREAFISHSQLKEMDYRSLQQVAKDHGIKANQKHKKLLKTLLDKVANSDSEKNEMVVEREESAGQDDKAADAAESNQSRKSDMESDAFRATGPNFHVQLSTSLMHRLSSFELNALDCLSNSAFSEDTVAAAKLMRLISSFIDMLPSYREGTTSSKRYPSKAKNSTFMRIKNQSPRLNYAASSGSSSTGLLASRVCKDGKEIPIDPSSFVSLKLVQILKEQFKHPLAVTTYRQSFPEWCAAMIENMPLLVPTSTRVQYHAMTSFGISRTIDNLQKKNESLSSARDAASEAERAQNVAMTSSSELQQVQAATVAAQAADRLHEVEMKHSVGSLRCDIAKVRRGSMLIKDSMYLMRTHRTKKNKLEVQFKGENGFGDGVTQGYFSSIAKSLQQRSINKERPMWIPDCNASEGTLSNKYGLMPKPLPPADLLARLSPKNFNVEKLKELKSQRNAVLKRFEFLGILMGKALLDGCIVPLPLTTSFFSLVQGHKLPAKEAIRLVEGDNGFVGGLLKVIDIIDVLEMQTEHDVSRMQSRSTPENLSSTAMFLTVSGNELCSIFGSNFFTGHRSDLDGQKLYMSINAWLKEMDLRFVDPTLSSFSSLNAPKQTASLHQQIVSAQRAGNMALVRSLMLKATKKRRGGDSRRNESSSMKGGKNASERQSFEAKNPPDEAGADTKIFSAVDELYPASSEDLVLPTRESLKRYTSLVLERWFGSGIAPQINAFRAGMESVFPVDTLKYFTPSELRTLFCGEPKVIWNTEILMQEILVPTDDMSHDSEVFKLLVKELVAMNNRERAQFLEFVTAIPRLTPGTRINVSYQRTGSLPTARTCTYDLYLPAYKKHEELNRGIKEAVANGLKAGFHEGVDDGQSTMFQFLSSPRPSPMMSPNAPPSNANAAGSRDRSSSSSVGNLDSLSPLPPPAVPISEPRKEPTPNGAEYPGLSLRFDSSDVGAVILVFWSGPQILSPRWFQGVVNHYNDEQGHYVIYPDDQDMQWHNLRTTRYRLLAPGKNATP